MKTRYILLLLILVQLMTFSCKKLEKVMLITTANPATIGYNSAAVSGQILDYQQGTVSYAYEYGHCYSKTPNVNIANGSRTSFTNLLQPKLTSFTSQVKDLAPNTTYYIKAYFTMNNITHYSKEINFKTATAGPATINDADGNTYNVIVIGSQVWLKENLKTTKYNDNTAITLRSLTTDWTARSSGYCWFNNDMNTYKNTYGALYNWYAVNTGKLCPTGWHVPNDAEWTTLYTYLGGKSLAGGKLKETGTTHWLTPNTGATNETTFTALPGSYRNEAGTFVSPIGQYGYFYSSSDYTTNYIYGNSLSYASATLSSTYLDKRVGLSVRCLKN